MNLEFNFGALIHRDNMPLRDRMDHNLLLPKLARTCNVIDRSGTINSYEQISGSMFIMAQHGMECNHLNLQSVHEVDWVSNRQARSPMQF
jgi:hypothetical protein